MNNQQFLSLKAGDRVKINSGEMFGIELEVVTLLPLETSPIIEVQVKTPGKLLNSSNGEKLTSGTMDLEAAKYLTLVSSSQDSSSSIEESLGVKQIRRNIKNSFQRERRLAQDRSKESRKHRGR